MSLGSWLARLERMERKTKRRRIRSNVRAYRKRKQADGMKRIEVYLTAKTFEALRAAALPNEPYCATVSRLLTGNRETDL